MPGFFLHNFGCRATQADGSAIERELELQGMERAPSEREAEVVVLNTCTVTAAADHDARAAIRRVHRENPTAKIMVTGCYAQRAPQEIGALPGVTWVVGNSHKHRVAEIACAGTAPDFVPAENLALSGPPFTFIGDIFAHTELMAAPVMGMGTGIGMGNEPAEKTRPNLKVQDGCNNRCSFCIIPSVRGRSRSMPLDKVVEHANALAAAGYQEMVLSGINLGRWGRDLAPPRRFAQLLRVLLDRARIEKIRISSVEPMDWTDELIELMADSPRIAKHAHAPLQSGSDPVLRGMHRRYRPWHYAERIHRIRQAIPEGAIGADVMTGFPGETDEQFEESRRFIERQPFTYLHVFTYSARPGTASSMMPGRVPVQVARRRNHILRELAAQKNLAFRSQFVGRSLEVITLGHGREASTEALSDNYLKVTVGGQHRPNLRARAIIQNVTAEGLSGTLA